MNADVAVDVVVLTLDGGQTVGDTGRPELRFLAVRREEEPFAGCWSLPGRILRPDEDLDDAVATALAAVAGEFQLRHVEQLATFGAPDRDPRGRVVSVSHLGLVPEPVAVRGAARWWPADGAAAPGGMAFDHDAILAAGVSRLRSKLGYSNVAYGLLPDEFTLRELQDVYEAVVGDTIDKRNFRKKVLGLGLLADTEHLRRGPHRPAQLYRFAQPGLVTIDAAAII